MGGAETGRAPCKLVHALVWVWDNRGFENWAFLVMDDCQLCVLGKH